MKVDIDNQDGIEDSKRMKNPISKETAKQMVLDQLKSDGADITAVEFTRFSMGKDGVPGPAKVTFRVPKMSGGYQGYYTADVTAKSVRSISAHDGAGADWDDPTGPN